MTSRKGAALIICSPSGGGKSTLISRLIAEFPNFSFSISYTTRNPRPGEKHGREYYFVDRSEFEDLINRHFFAEWAEVHANYYGTPLQTGLDLLESGKDIIFDIDVQGAEQLRKSMPDSISIFILPPSRQVLKQRLTKRGSDDAKELVRRLEAARQEIGRAGEFAYWVLNQDLEPAYERLKSIYLAEKCRSSRNREMLRDVLKTWEDQGTESTGQ
ncbi:MAG: guanylate kinase [Desulfohalobiaceae bacterium]|nr:guanylate kinase [Desulfohalobiaceae bacterium]